MKNIFFALLILPVISCEPSEKQQTTNLVELQLDSLKTDFKIKFNIDQEFSDSLCNEGMELAKKLSEDNIYRFYDIESRMDSSSTPTVLLRDELNFIILGEYDKNMSYKHCYNQATLNFFYDQMGYNAFDYIKNKYDSLYELGMTEETPMFNGSKMPDALDKYIYCNLNLSLEKPPYSSVSIQFRITKEGQLNDLKIANSDSHKNDSIVYNLIKDQSNKWSARRMHGGGTSWYEFFLIYEYNPANVKKHCI